MVDVDIAIIGGGATGMLLAAGLARSKRRIILLDNGPSQPAIPHDIALVLNATSQQILDRMGLSSVCIDAYPLQQCVVSARGHWGRMRFSAKEASLPQLGSVLPAAVCYKRLHEVVTQATELEHITRAQVTDIRYQGSYSQIGYQQADQQKTLKAAVVLACDGAQSLCRRHFGVSVETDTVPYQAAVLPVALREVANQVAYQRFLCPGSLAYIPTSADQARLIMTLPTAQIQARMKLPSSALMRLLHTELGQLAYTIAEPLGPLRAYPVSMQRATTLATSQGVLLGAAATQLLPITAQGMNLAIRDMDSLYQMITRGGEHWWGAEQAASYHKSRYPDHDAHYQQIQALLRVFHRRGAFATVVRSLGLGTVGSWRSASRLCALHGAGFQVSAFDIGW